MNNTHTDTLIVGLGAMGSATAYFMEQQGRDFIGIDQLAPPHDLGSTHGETRLIRAAYFEHPNYVPILKESIRLWHSLNIESPEKLFVDNGLVLGGENSQIVQASLESARKHHVEVETLSNSDLVNTPFRWPKNCTGLFEPGAGYLFCDQATSFFLRSIDENRLRLNSKVVRWSAKKDHIQVETAHEIIKAKKVIWTVGAWSSRFNPLWGNQLHIYRVALHWYHSQQKKLQNIPCYGFDSGERFFYGFPEINGLVKCALHHPECKITDPDDYIRTIEEHEAKPVDSFASTFFREKVGARKKSSTCLYTMSHDEHFYLDLHPADKRMFMACGFSGHGFKFAPFIGQQLATWADGKSLNPGLNFFRKNRGQ